MHKKLVLPKDNLSIDLEDAGFIQRRSYEEIIDYFPRKGLEVSISEFSDEVEILKKAIKKSLNFLKEKRLIDAFAVWFRGNYVKNGFPDYAKMLVEKKILQFEDARGHDLIIKNLKEEFFVDILESIRCRKDIDIWHREILVVTFWDFVNWLWVRTRLISFPAKDRDKDYASDKALGYDDFINFLSKLDDKIQLVAKLLYFGKKRTMAEVLNIEVEDIDFSNRYINFGLEKIFYPKHVFEDIKALISNQTIGKIFSGKKNTSLNPATVFRNFKEASIKLGLKKIYTPKILTTTHLDAIKNEEKYWEMQ